MKVVTIDKFCNASGAMCLHPEEAQRRARPAYSQLSDGVDVTEEKRRLKAEEANQKAQTLGVFIEDRYSDWALHNIKTHAKILKAIHTDFGHWYPLPMKDISPWMISAWRTAKLKQGLKASTVNRYVSNLRGVFSKAVEWAVLRSHPLAGVKQLKIDLNPAPRFLSIDEETRLRKCLDNREQQQRSQRKSYNQWLSARGREALPDKEHSFTDHLRPVVLIALNSGLRRGEIFNLKWVDIDLANELLTVRGTGAKSGQTRHVPLNVEAKFTLTAWQEQTQNTGFVFPNPVTGKRFDNIQSSWEEVLKNALLKFEEGHPLHFTFHGLRHTFASKLVMQGASLYDVKELLGHKSIETTQKYAHLAPEHKAKVVALLNM